MPSSIKEYLAIAIIAMYVLFSTAMTILSARSVSYLTIDALMTGGVIFYPTVSANGTQIWNQNIIQFVPKDLRLSSTRAVLAAGVLGILESIAIITLILLPSNNQKRKHALTILIALLVSHSFSSPP